MPFWNLFWLIAPAVVLLGAAVWSYRRLDPRASHSRRSDQPPTPPGRSDR
jgi:hypothetical protein